MIESFWSLAANLQEAAWGPAVTRETLSLGPQSRSKRGQVRVKRAQAVRDRAPNLLLLGVESQLGLDVLDVNHADALGLARGVGLGERPTGRGRECSWRRTLRRGVQRGRRHEQKCGEILDVPGHKDSWILMSRKAPIPSSMGMYSVAANRDTWFSARAQCH